MEEHPIYGFARHYNPKLTDSEIQAKYIDNGQYMKTLEMLRKDSYSDLDPDEFLTRFHAKFEDLSKKKASSAPAQDLSGASYSWESGDPKLSAKISSPKAPTSLSGSSGTLTPEAMVASKRASQELALQKARQRPNFEKAADLTEYEKAQAEGSILKPEKEYEARLNTLRTDSDNLQRAIEASEARIKEKWGENWMQDYYARQEAIEDPGYKYDKNEVIKRQQEFEADQFINDRNKFITALEANQSSGAQILKDDKYAYARALEKYDQERQKKSETQGWGNLTLGILQRATGKLVGSVGEVMNIGENLVTQDKKYNAWDKIEDFFIDFQDQTAKVAPRPTKYTRPLYTKTAKTTLNGEKVEVDFDGDKPAVVRDSKGVVIDADPNQFKDLKAKNQYNSKGLIYQTGEVLADAMVQIATTKGIGGTLVKTGMGAKLAYATGVTASTMGQMAGGLYDQGLKMFDGDKRKAAQYATMTGLAIGVGSNLFGLEARLAGGPGVFEKLTVSEAVKGLTPKAAAARTATNFFKEGVGEAFEETILEKGIEGATAMVLNGDAEDIDLNEMKGTALISFAVGALMGGAESDFKNSAWVVAAENPDLFKAELEKQGVKNADKMYQKALKIKGLSEIKEVSEEDIPKLDELTDLQDKAEKAKAIGAKEQAKIFEEQAAAKEVEIFKEKSKDIETRMDQLVDEGVKQMRPRRQALIDSGMSKEEAEDITMKEWLETPQGKEYTSLENGEVIQKPVVEQTEDQSKLDISAVRGGYEGSFVEGKEKIGEGSEHTVYRDGDKVIKVSEPYNAPETYQRRVDDALLISELVGDGSTEVIGYYESKNGTKNPVFSQNFIEGETATEEEAREHLLSKGFEEVNGGFEIVKGNKRYRITDLSDNFIKTKDGMVAIDAGIEEIGTVESAKQKFEQSVDTSIADLNITQEQADALKKTTEASAKNWAKRTGNTEEEFYEKFKPAVSRETSKIPDDALKQIVGEKANVAEARKSLAVAKRSDGRLSPQLIYLATGWEKVDGKWKYDLPDVEVGTLEGTNKLGDVAKGGILDAYPDAKDIEVTVDPNLKTLGVRQGNKITIRDGADKSTLIHELQHWVQQKEGFAGGASLDRVSGGMFSKLQEAKTKFFESNPNLAKALKGEDVELSEDDVAKLVENKELLNEYYKTVKDIFKKYQSVVGEVEARNAEARAKMTPAERRLTPISETEDTKDKIYLDGKVVSKEELIGGENTGHPEHLLLAKIMEEQGFSPEKIFAATNFERGKDGQWRHEIGDIKMRDGFNWDSFGDRYMKPLSELVDSEVFKYYPELKGLIVNINNTDTQGTVGNYMPMADSKKEKNLDVPYIYVNIPDSDTRTLEYVLAHEIQHAIQEIEGFSTGGNIIELGQERYLNVAGEVEARNVETRMDMTPEEKAKISFSKSEDTARSLQEVRYLQQQEGQTLGAFSTIDGAASAWLFDGATVETLFHEIDPTTGHFGHAVLYDILDNALPEHKAQAEADVKAIEEFLGASDRNWTREQHEMFVAAGEKYLREGVAPTPELRPVFERLKQWLTDIFNSIKDRVDIDITPEVRQVFARMMGKEEMLPLIEEVNRAEGQPGFASGFVGEKVWGVVMKSGAMNWLKKAWKYTFFGRGDLPIDVAQLNYRRIARIEGMMKQAELTANKLKKIIKGKSKQQIEDLNYALQSTATTYSDGRQIEPEILDLVAKMREHVKAMSSELINTGIADGKLAAIISQNLDTYLTRSYQIHFNKNWVKTVKDTTAYTRAKAFLDKKFAQEEADAQAKIAKYQAKLSNNPEYWGKRIKNQQKRIGRDVEAELDSILEKQAKGLSLGDVAKSGSLGSMNLGVFKKRKEIAEEIRDVFGEVKDPIVNYMTSIFKVAHILENNKFLSKVEDEGKNKFLFERPTGSYTSQFPDTPQMGPLAGYYSTPEIVEAFRLYNKPIGDMTDDSNPIEAVYKGMLSITSRAKSFMTIFSIASAARNFTSNLLLQTQKGLFNITNIANGKVFDPNIQKAFDLFKGDNEAELVELYSLGVLGDGITFGEIADVRKQYSRNFAGIDNTPTGQLAEKGRMMTKFMSYIYQFGDEFYRAIDYYRNLDKMARLYMGQEYETLSPDAQQEVKQMAAERVSSENPTYSRLPRNIKALRRNPFLAPFPSFPYEMVRVSYNIMDNLVRDMKNGQDTKVKVGGVEMSYKNLMLGKVMAGTMAVSIAPFLLKELITNMLGWSDDDDEKLKYFVPFYHEGSLLIPSPWNEKKGSVDYYDWGYMFPQGHILSTLSTVSDERFSPAENVGRAAEKFFEPFYSPDPLMKSIVEAVSGRQLGKNGRPISQVGETDWLKARMGHVGKKLTPGTIKSFERVFRSFNEPETDYYGKLTPIQELVAIFPGFRSYNVDIHRSFGFIGRNMAEKINDSKADYGVEKNKEQVKALPPKERKEHLDKIKERELKDYEKFVLDFHKIYMAAIEFPGVDKKRIDEALADVGLDAITREGVKTGKVKIPEYFKK